MFAAVGNHVVALHRASVGGLAIPDDLAPGEFMVLNAAGVARFLWTIEALRYGYGAIPGSVTIYGYVMIFADECLNRPDLLRKRLRSRMPPRRR